MFCHGPSNPLVYNPFGDQLFNSCVNFNIWTLACVHIEDSLLKFQNNASSSNNVLKHIEHKIDCFKDPIPYLDLNDYGENVYEKLKEYKDNIYVLKVLIKGQLKRILSTTLYYNNYSLCGGEEIGLWHLYNMCHNLMSNCNFTIIYTTINTTYCIL